LKPRKVAKKNTLIKYMLIYLVIILVFAVLYTSMSDQFYHSTILHESVFDKDTNLLKKDLELAISKNFKQYHKQDMIYLDENKRWLFNINDLKINGVTYNEMLFIDFSFKITNMANRLSNKLKSSDAQYFSSFRIELHNDFLSANNVVYRFGEVEKKEKDFTGAGLNSIRYSPIFFLAGLDEKGIVGINTTAEVNQQLIKFVDEVKGEPNGVEHNFLRMLYLSMVTITTLGYGDIVPLTNGARVLIGIEATIGIVIMGLFVNSLLNKSK